MLLLYVIVVLVTLFLGIKRYKYLKQFRYINGPPPLPIIGNYLFMKRNLKNIAIFNEFPAKYGKTAKIFTGMRLSLLTTDVKLLEVVMNSPNLINKSDDYILIFNRWLGDGLLISSGDKWRAHRKILTPAFHYKILEDFIEVFESRGKFLVDNLLKASREDCVNVHTIFSLYTLDVICDTAMGTSVNAQCNPDHKYMEAIKTMLDIAVARIMNPIYRNEWAYKFTNIYKTEMKALETITSFSLGIIEKRRKFLESRHSVDENECDEFGKRRKMTFMDILLKSTINGKPLTNEEIRQEVDTFLFEGHDTTSAAISFTCYNLSKNPEVQKLAYEEICHVLPTDRAVTIEDLQNLKYLEMVIKESLRLYPSVAFHARVVDKEFDYNGTKIPKDIMIAINQYTLHRDPVEFPDPEKFDPLRFTAEKQSKRHPLAYIPFSAGHRNCIGQKFAMLELKSAIAKVIKNFELLPVPGYSPQLISKVTLTSDNGICVKLKPRSA
ncbi:PREDICTED: probable cytochrome P450 4d14 isoform X2 [Nicrophorus vespilloides]|uniref:Probable cytochrome P450 4d14 isoform X2 n=1 Tax=Nicrophorus vespilloides TaxID=110193 RepID=A0ABM1NK79_NICVS|nr:PREDICTED: probable cytochrome P450 4d14 isoform X2 [Nicrophorus vespilloides]